MVRELADEIATADAERAELSAGLEGMLSEDETYRCPLTVPGIGPKTAAALVTSIDISLFKGDSRLAAYCDLAPKDSDSGTSLSSMTSTRAGNKALKNLLIFSCNSLVGTKNRFGRYYDRRQMRRQRHAPQQGAQGGRAEEAQGDLCRHARQGAIYRAISGRGC